MRRNLLSTISILTGMIWLSSCSSDNSTVKVPKDAAVVVHINAPGFASKLSWQEIKQTDWFKEMYAQAPDSLVKKLLDDPDNAGMDTKADLTFFIKKQGKGGYIVFEGAVKDAAAFETFNKKISQTGDAVAKEGDFTSLKLQRQAIVTWNAKHFAYVIDAPIFNMMAAIYDRRRNEGNDAFPTDSLKKFGQQTLTLEGGQNLTKDDRFAALLKDKGDVHFWINAEQYYNTIGGGFMSLLKLNVLFDGNVSASSLSFDNGKIAIDSKQYYNKEMEKLLDKYPSKEVSAELFNRIPSQNVVAAFGMNYPPDGLKEFLKLIGVDGFANSYLGNIGYSMDEFIKANKGDILLSVSDFEIKTQEESYPNPNGGAPFKYTRTVPSVKVLFATSINDRPAFDKLITTLKAQLPEGSEQLTKDITYQLNNNWFAAGNDADQVSKFLAGGNSKLPFADKIGGHAFGGYVDIQRIIKGSAAETKDSTSMAIRDVSLATWQDVLMTYGGSKEGAVTSHVEINMVDKNTNSLKQLNQYAEKVYKIQQAQKARFEAQYNNTIPDTSAAVPPPPPPAN